MTGLFERLKRPLGPIRRVTLQRMVPGGRLSGLLPWILGVMTFIAALAVAAALALADTVETLDQAVDGQVTVQILIPDPARAIMVETRIVERLRAAGALNVRAVPESELRAELAPWLGATDDPDLPLPRVVEARKLEKDPGPSLQKAIESALDAQDRPQVRLEENGQWLAPVSNLVSALKLLAFALVGLATVTCAGVVILAARAALDTHRSTVEVMHLIGATDPQIAGVFQHRALIDSLIGAYAGLILALPVIGLVGARLGALRSGIAEGAGLGAGAWMLLFLVPLAVSLLATITARFTVLRALRRANA